MPLLDRFRSQPSAAAPIAPTGDTQATVTRGGLVELFNQDGLPVYVADTDVESWLRQGLSRTRYDVEAEIAAIPHIFETAKTAVLEHINEARAQGAVQRDAHGVVAQTAFSQLVAAYGRLVVALEHAYPHQEPAQ